MTEPGTIYDLGMHNGDDTEYYLAKGYRVIAVEANPLLCAEAEERFAETIAAGRLRVLNLAIAETSGEAEFYVKRERAPQSSLRAAEGHDRLARRDRAHRAARRHRRGRAATSRS